MNYFIFSLLLLLFFSSNSTLIYVEGVPVDNYSLLRAQVALSRWENTLNNNYRKPFENRWTIRTRTDQVDNQLKNLSQQLANYNNVVIGTANGVIGTKNLIIGNRNGVVGSNNFVFTSDFNSQIETKTGTLSNSLVSDKWIA